MDKVATIVDGPSVWWGYSGAVEFEDDEWVVLRISARDGGRVYSHALRLPKLMVDIEDAVAQA